MASSVMVRPLGQRLLPNRVLAGASLLLAAAAIAAIMRGHADWSRVPPLVWLHLAAVLTATLLTPVMLVRRKGDRPHRWLGYAWVGGMMIAAASSLFFNTANPNGWGVFSGNFSPIHLLSVFVLVLTPKVVTRARRHDRAGHEAMVRGLVIGGLLVAGFFTFPFQRLLGHWLFG